MSSIQYENNALLLSKLMSLSKDIIIILSHDYEIIKINHILSKLVPDIEQIIGENFLVYCEHQPILLTKIEFNSLLFNNKIEKGISSPNGEFYYFSWSLHKINNEDSNSSIILIADDITDTQRVSSLNKENQTQLERISEVVPGNFYWKNTKGEYLGCNLSLLTMLGMHSIKDIIGKNDYDLWPEEADEIRSHDKQVMLSKKAVYTEETVNMNGKNMFFTVIKMPLFGENDRILGILGNSLDITKQKEMEENLKAAKETAESALKSLQQSQIEEVKHREKVEQLAVENAKHKAELEAQAAFTNTIDKAAHDIGSPMSGLVTTMECLGGLEDVTTVDGYSMALVSENTRQKNILYLQKKDTGLDFEVLGKNDALEKGHILWDDILIELKKSSLGDTSEVPVFQKECLGILLNILINKDLIKKSINEKRVPEDYRIQVRDAIEKIKDITEDLISRYTKGSENKNEPKQLVLISTVLNQLISEKRMGFLRKGIELKEEFSPESLFAFVNIQSTQVNRAISNIMNNAAQAFDGKPGNVILKLRSDNESVYISVCDNGKGMTPEMVEKIKNKITFTEGKKDGHGIGLSQVRDTLEHNHGKMTIESEVGVGTTFTLTFSKKIPPAWAIDKIQVTPHDIILILDDDNSIHGAWDLRFKPLIKKHPHLKIEHFTFSAKLLNFLATVPEENKKNLFLLTDYELLNQQDNGVQVMQQTKIKRSTLVTSHYAKTDIQNQVMTLNAKLLPKQLASFIPVVVSEVQKNDGQPNHVDAVWLDDEPSFTSSHEKVFIKKNKKVDIYRTPQELKDNLHLYSKETPVFLDNNFAPPFQDYHGTQIAKELHDMGFSKLSLITGEDLDQDDYPYLKIIKKHSLDDLTRYF